MKQYVELFKMDGVALDFEPAALDMVVDRAVEYKLGARGLRGIMEGIMTGLMFDLPQRKADTSYTLTAEEVRKRLR